METGDGVLAWRMLRRVGDYRKAWARRSWPGSGGNGLDIANLVAKEDPEMRTLGDETAHAAAQSAVGEVRCWRSLVIVEHASAFMLPPDASWNVRVQPDGLAGIGLLPLDRQFGGKSGTGFRTVHDGKLRGVREREVENPSFTPGQSKT